MRPGRRFAADFAVTVHCLVASVKKALIFSLVEKLLEIT